MRLTSIFAWAFIAATVGVILRNIEERSHWGRKLLAGILGLAWTMASYLVIPVIVFEKQNPLAALRRSKELLRKSWGDQLLGNAGLGLFALLLSIPGLVAVVLVTLGFFQTVIGITVIISAVLAYLMLIALVQSALRAIFQVAVYLYARDGQVPQGFPPELIKNLGVSA